MTETNPRGLIRRLADALNDLSQHLEAESPAPAVQNAHKVWKEARAYLAQPEPEELTDEELNDMYWKAAATHPIRKNRAVHIAGLRAVLAAGASSHLHF